MSLTKQQASALRRFKYSRRPWYDDPCSIETRETGASVAVLKALERKGFVVGHWVGYAQPMRWKLTEAGRNMQRKSWHETEK